MYSATTFRDSIKERSFVLTDRLCKATGKISFINGSDAVTEMSYGELYDRALLLLYQMQLKGMRPGNEAILYVEENESFLTAFWACLIGGIIPVPISVGTHQEHFNKLTNVAKALDTPYLLYDNDLLGKVLADAGNLIQASSLINLRQLDPVAPEVVRKGAVTCKASVDDIAYIQFSSGSTGNVKGVTLTHANLAANICDILSRSGTSGEDLALSWMPLTHDMGLICFHLSCMVAGIDQYLMPTSLFIRRPVLWMETASRFRITQLYSPNFGYYYFMRAFRSSSEVATLDLTSVRIIYNGAEPISEKICLDFYNALKEFGLGQRVMFPGYGLAEASVAVSLPDVGDPVRTYCLDRKHLNTGGEVKILKPGADGGVIFVENGYPIDNCQVRVCDDKGEVLEDFAIGNIQIKGPNVTSGYYRNEEATQALFTKDKWLRTGDLGFLNDGRLTITGRKKNIIIVNSQNYYPQDIESAVYNSIEGMEPQMAVACAIREPDDHEDRLIIFVVHKGSYEAFVPLVARIRKVIYEGIGLVPYRVLPVKKIPKTTSGKIKYYLLVEQYNSGAFSDSIEILNHGLAQTAPDGDNDPNKVTTALTGLLREILGQEIGQKDDILSRGISSIQIAQVVGQVQKQFGVPLKIDHVFKFNTISALSEFVARSKSEDTVPVVAIESQQYYNLSFRQRSWWMLDQFQKENPASNIAVQLRLTGDLDVSTLQKAFGMVVSRHESLRTTFIDVEGEPRQRVTPLEPVSLACHDLRTFSDKDDRVGAIVTSRSNAGFNLAQGPLLRLDLIRTHDREHILLFVVHHIIADGWSIDLIIKELFEFYDSLTEGRPVTSAALDLQHKEITSWEAHNQKALKADENLSYWREEFKDSIPVLDSGKQRPPLKTFNGSTKSIVVTDNLPEQLKNISHENRSTLFMVLLSTIYVLLHRYYEQEEIVIGTSSSGRISNQLRNQVGNYLNTLGIRVLVGENDTFTDLLEKVRSKLVASLEHEHYSFDSLVEQYKNDLDASRSPFFDVLVIMQGFDVVSASGKVSKHLNVTVDSVPLQSSLVDLQLELQEKGSGIMLSARYNTDIFTSHDIDGLLLSYQNLVREIAADPGVLVKDYKLLDKEQEYLLLNDLQAERVSYDRSWDVIKDVESQAKARADSVALTFEESHLTYAVLNERADSLCDLLKGKYDLQADDLVGIYLGRSEQFIIAMLAVLKSGAAFVPVDPSSPAERIQNIIEDSRMRVLCTEGSLVNNIQRANLSVAIQLIDEPVKNTSRSENNSTTLLQPNQACYLLYTSGTTGKPKGVLVDRKALNDYVATFIRYFAISSDDVVVHQSAYSFDTFLEEILPALCSGARVVINNAGNFDIENLLATVEKNRATVLSTTPLVIKEINKQPSRVGSLRILISGGDKLKPAFVENLISRLSVYNTYGPTETTVCTSFHEIRQAADAELIGRPIANRRIYILDKHGKLRPPGWIGELCISGAGLSRGYLNQPELTAQKFVTNSFDPSTRIYRTGDLAQWTMHGELAIFGRNDSQIKIRGYRIEPGEVEKVICRYPDIQDAVICRQIRQDSNYLVAFFTAGLTIDINHLRRYVATVLPSYMLPALYHQVKEIPLNANGKVDRKKLEATVVEPEKSDLIRPHTIEHDLAMVWDQVLGKKPTALSDNFFSLGGDSIRATKLIYRIRNTWQVVLDIRQIFSHPDIQSQATLITADRESTAEKIETIAESTSYEVSHSQKRIWILDQLSNNNAYVISRVFTFNGPLNVARLGLVFDSLIWRHEILRTTFEEHDGEIRQKVWPASLTGFKIDHVDLRGNEDPDNNAREIVAREISIPFSLEKGPLLRVKLIQLGLQKHLFVFTVHHIISDAWSLEILSREIKALYERFEKGPLPALSFQYKDFAHWQNKKIRNDHYKDARSYWLDHLNGFGGNLSIGTDFPRPVNKTYVGKTIVDRWDNKLTDELSSIGGRNGTTMFMTLIALVKVLLFRYTSQRDIIVGTPVAGRSHGALDDQLGVYVNTVALRSVVHEEQTFDEYVERVKEVTLSALKYQDYPFDKLIEDLSVKGDLGRSPLFDILIGFRHATAPNGFSHMGPVGIEPYEIHNATTQFDLSINFLLYNDVLEAHFEYNTDLFKADRIVRFNDHLKTLIHSVANEPRKKIREYSILSAHEQEHLLTICRGERHFVPEETLHRLFEKQVLRSPEATAVRYAGASITYNELNKKSNQLARYLREKFSILPNERIGLMAEGNAAMIMGLFAILKAGAVYVPMDPDLPENRFDFIANDCQLKVIIGSSELKSSKKIPLVRIEDVPAGINGDNLSSTVEASDPAYIIYTSGTSGRPKGVIVSHRSVVNLIGWMSSLVYGRKQQMRAMLTASITFDASVQQVFGSLLNGGTLIPVTFDTKRDQEEMLALIRSEGPQIIDVTPSYLEMLLDTLAQDEIENNIETVLCGGEPLPVKTAKRHSEILGPACQLVNVYGPTEATVNSTYEIMDTAPQVEGVIGKPIFNVEAYVLDEFRNLVPVGVEGELYISGAGISSGYLNNPILTSEKFITNPFVTSSSLLYKTGDRAVLLPDGKMVCKGRLDSQVKIRGYRIELGEIEQVILQHSSIQSAVVTVRDEGSVGKLLIAYLIESEGTRDKELIGFIKEHLPEYMVPAHFVRLNKFPLTSSGKIDLRALPAPVLHDRPFVPPGDVLERQLASIWEKLLGVTPVGMQHDFFSLGGNSLTAMRLLNRVHKVLGVKLDIQAVFKNTTLESLARAVRNSQQESYKEIVPLEDQFYYELSHAQQRIWVLQQFREIGSAYYMPDAFVLSGPLNHKAFDDAFLTLIARHEILRTHVVIVDNEPKQKVCATVAENGVKIEYLDFREVDKSDRKLQDAIGLFFEREFDLLRPPLVRVSLLQTGADEHLLLFNAHHIVLDGWSVDILVNQVVTHYNINTGKGVHKPIAHEVQYKDYTAWARHRLEGGLLEPQKLFWRNVFNGPIPILDLPLDKPRPVIKTYNGDTIKTTIGPSYVGKLNEACLKHDTSLFVLLTASVKLLLYKYTRQTDIVIGAPSSGRNHLNLETQIGLFIDTVPIRTIFNEKDTFTGLLLTVKENVINALKNQDYPLDELIRDLNPPRDTSRSPLFDVMVSFRDIRAQERKLHELNSISVRKYSVPSQGSKFDVLFNFFMADNELTVALDYNTDLYNKDTAENLLEHYSVILGALLENDSQPIDQIKYFGEREMHKLVYEFNNSKVPYPADQTIVDLFAERAMKSPGNRFIISGGRSYTYGHIDVLSNKLAKALNGDAHVIHQDRVGIMMDNTEHLMIAILSVLKAGACYVPIDPNFPEARKNYIVADCSIKILLTDNDAAPLNQVRSINLQKFDYSHYDDQPVTVRCSPEDLIYILYTSGSTGKPKGVKISHKGVVNLAYWLSNTFYGRGESPTIAMLTASISFDASVQQLFAPMITGSALLMQTGKEKRDALAFVGNLVNYPVTIIDITPNFLAVILDELAKVKDWVSLKYTLVGGEVLSPEVRGKYKSIFGTSSHLVNVYGLTETTVDSTYDIISEDSSLYSIGKPVPNNQIYILDNKMAPVAIGVAGDIYIGGVGVSKGFMNLDELTSEKFVDDPFVPGSKVYRTGDLGRWLHDGTIEFFGRVDRQLKIRGYRIEAGEIESTLSLHPLVKQAAVTAVENEFEGKALVAYVIPRDTVDSDELKAHLSALLPKYMVPSRYVFLSAFPLNVSGKVDLKVLPPPSSMDPGKTEEVEPSNETELALLNIWRNILVTDNIGVMTDFFHAGGHSLLAVKLVTVVFNSFGVKLDLQDIFIYPTVRQLAEKLRQTGDFHFAFQPIEEQQYYKPSNAQLRLWLLDQSRRGHNSYIIKGIYRLTGRLNVDALRGAFNTIVSKHESLRTTFPLINGVPMQKVGDATGIELEDMDATAGRKKMNIDALIAGEMSASFDLQSGPLLRARLLRTADEEFLLIFLTHHIISDGWSVQVLARDLVRLYNDLNDGKPSGYVNRYQQRDFITWKEKYLASIDFRRHKEYWLRELQGELPRVDLSLDYPRPARKAYSGRALKFKFQKVRSREITQVASENRVSLFTCFIAVFNALVYRYTGKKDIIIGLPVSGRNNPLLDDQIGFYVNMVALRLNVSGSEKLVELIAATKSKLENAYRCQDYPFDQLVDDLQLPHDTSRSPLFDIVLSFEDRRPVEGHLKSMNGVQVSQYNYDERTSKFDLVLNLIKTTDDIALEIEYDDNLYREQTINSIFHDLEAIVAAIASDRELLLNSHLVTSTKGNERIGHFNNTDVSYPVGKRIETLFADQVRRSPRATAVVQGDRSITYIELEEISNRIARYLKTGCALNGPEIVGVIMDRSAHLPEILLGIMKAGCAYLPMDPEYPADRINYIIADAAVKVVFVGSARSEFEHKLPKVRVVSLIDDGEEIERCAASPIPAVDCDANGPAYVIYTSGSTGKPKGVMVNHSGLANLCFWHIAKFSLDQDSRATVYSSIGFDACGWEIWPYLLSGGSLYPLNGMVRYDLEMLSEFLRANRITHTFLPTLVCENMSGYFQKLEHSVLVLTGGDKLRKADFGNIKVVNNYGPTEGTVVATSAYVNSGNTPDVIPIGRPIDNVRVYIVDENFNLTGPNGVGEICIGGASLAAGYLNNPELTAEKFISNPFGPQGSILYRTGDKGRWLPDGEIEFIGRSDLQVKIRGNRVEPAEVEARLLRHRDVTNAVVKTASNETEIFLVAYVVFKKRNQIKSVQKYLGQWLPSFMLPKFVIPVKEIRMTVNGKVDYASLPHWEKRSTRKVTRSLTAYEAGLLRICQEVLQKESVEIKGNLFHIGCNSLKAAQIISRVAREFNIKLELANIFESPTIHELARLMERSQISRTESIVPVKKQIHYPVSHAQKALWILEQVERGTAHNIPGAFLLKGDLNAGLLEKAFQTIIGRHEVLRTNFINVNGEPRQIIRPAGTADFQIKVLRGDRFMLRETDRFIRKHADVLFDLETGWLLDVKLVQSTDDSHLLVINIHHIIADGWSIEILFDEIVAAYNSFLTDTLPELTPLKFHYKDFVHWQNKYLGTEAGRNDQSYWIGKFAEEIAGLELSDDYTKASGKTWEGNSRGITFRSDELESIRHFCISKDASLFMFLMSAVKVLLYSYTGQDDIIVGMPAAGRINTEVEKQIGLYVNLLGIRTKLDPNDGFQDVLNSVRRNVLDSLKHEQYPLDLILEQLSFIHPRSRHASLFDVLVNLSNVKPPEQRRAFLDGVEVEELPVNTTTSKHKLSFFFAESPSGLSCELVYNSNLFKADRIGEMLAHVREIAALAVHDPNISLASMEARVNKSRAKAESNASLSFSAEIEEEF